MMRGGASEGSPASIFNLFAPSCDSDGRPMLLTSKSGLAMISTGGTSGFELVKEHIVFNKRKRRYRTGENMAKLYKKHKFDDKETGNDNTRASIVYISFILEERPIRICSLFIELRFQCVW